MIFRRLVLVTSLMALQVVCVTVSSGVEKRLGPGEILEQAVQAAVKIRNKADKAQVLSLIGSAQAKSGERDAAKQSLQHTVETIDSMQIGPSRDQAIRMLAASQALAGDVQGALKTAAKSSDVGAKRDVLWSIVVQQAESGDAAGAISTSTAIENQLSQSESLTAIAWVQAKRGDVKAALKTAGAIQNDKARKRALGEIAVEQAQVGDVDGALQAVDEIRDDTIRVDALRIIARNLARSGDVKGAQQAISRIPVPSEPNYAVVDAFAEIAVAQVKAGDSDGALQTAAVVSESLTSVILSRVAEEQAKAGHTEDAVRTVMLIKNELHRPSAFQHVAIAQAEAGDISGAKDTMASIKSDPDMQIAFLGAVAVAQVRTGQLSQVRQTVTALLAINGDGYTLMNALRAIGVAFVRVGRLNEAMETIAPIEGLMYRSPALQDIALAQAEIRNFDGAWRTAGLIQEKLAKVGTLHEIGKAQAKTGDVKESVARSIKLLVPFERAHALLGIAEGILANGST